MSPKPGTPVSIVAPIVPTLPQDALDADSGSITKVASLTAINRKAVAQKTVSAAHAAQAAATASTAPAEKAAEPDPEKKHFIEILLVDEEGTPQGGLPYRLKLPDGGVMEGTLDGDGKARVDGVDPGKCKVEFPTLDEKLWKPK